jgi:hypothetical protein
MTGPLRRARGEERRNELIGLRQHLVLIRLPREIVTGKPFEATDRALVEMEIEPIALGGRELTPRIALEEIFRVQIHPGHGLAPLGSSASARTGSPAMR